MKLAGGRRLWLKVHLYLGLWIGAALALLGVSGSVLVFSDQIDQALNPHIAAEAAPDASAREPQPDEVLSLIERQLGVRPYMLELPTEVNGRFLAFIDEDEGEAESLRTVLVDARTGEILANRAWGSYFVSFMRRLHTSLFMNDAGNWVVAVLGVIGLVSAVTGIVLWWPRGSAWKWALTFHWQRRAPVINFESHRLFGFYLSIVLVVVTASGIYLATSSLWESEAEHEPARVPVVESLRAVQEPMSLAAVAQIVQRHATGALVTGFHVPPKLEEPIAAFYRGAGEPHSRFGRSVLWIDQQTGDITQKRAYGDLSSGERFMALQILLHNGEIAGRTGEWLVFASGLALMVLFGTGLYLWWIKRRPRRGARASTRVWRAGARSRASSAG